MLVWGCHLITPASPDCDGGLEVGLFTWYWIEGGEPSLPVVKRLEDVGEPTLQPVYATPYPVLVGDPSLGKGLLAQS